MHFGVSRMQRTLPALVLRPRLQQQCRWRVAPISRGVETCGGLGETASLPVAGSCLRGTCCSHSHNNYLGKILNARVYEVAHETPLQHAPILSASLNNRVLLKREDLQPVFSFKIRGAYNKISQLSREQLSKVRASFEASPRCHACMGARDGD